MNPLYNKDHVRFVQLMTDIFGHGIGRSVVRLFERRLLGKKHDQFKKRMAARKSSDSSLESAKVSLTPSPNANITLARDLKSGSGIRIDSTKLSSFNMAVSTGFGSFSKRASSTKTLNAVASGSTCDSNDKADHSISDILNPLSARAESLDSDGSSLSSVLEVQP